MAPHKRKKTKHLTAAQRLGQLRLPVGGACPFVPPKGWNSNMPLPRGPNNSYIDRRGREWVKGRSITPGEPFEWDVQVPPDLHKNISLGGDVTH